MRIVGKNTAPPAEQQGRDPNDDGSNTILKITPEQMQNILGELTEKKTVVDKAMGKLRSAIKAILETNGFNKTALGIVRTLDAMSTTQRNDVMRTLEPMMAAMGALKWDQEKADLFGDAED